MLCLMQPNPVGGADSPPALLVGSLRALRVGCRSTSVRPRHVAPTLVERRDNRNPRDFPNRIEGLAKRAWDAHLNAFESLPGFAAAVIVAHLAHTPQVQADVLASVWVVARVAHLTFYLADQDNCGRRGRLLVFSVFWGCLSLRRTLPLSAGEPSMRVHLPALIGAKSPAI